MIKSNRKQDFNTSLEIEKLMDEFYKGRIPFERVEDVDLQKSGVDVILELKSGNKIYVDEKCATDYINRELKTFSFELRATPGRYVANRYDGWLIAKDNITTHYMLIYVLESEKDKHPRAEDIKKVETILVSKKKILQYLHNLGQTKEVMFNKCEDIDAGDTNFGRIENGFKYSKSKFKIEAPINILIPKTELRRMSDVNTILEYENGRNTRCTTTNL